MATTRDIADRPRVAPNTLVWLELQKPNTLMMFDNGCSQEPLVMSEERLTEKLNRHDRRGGVVSYMEAIELRICAWPQHDEPQVLLERRNTAAMETLALAFRIYSR